MYMQTEEIKLSKLEGGIRMHKIVSTTTSNTITINHEGTGSNISEPENQGKPKT
jgi:hypothetical protein